MNKFKYIVLLGMWTMMMSCARPVAKFMVDQTKDVVPSTLKFKNESLKAEVYEWDFGDGKTSNKANPDHKYYLSGKYTVKLKAKKGNKTSITEKEVFFKAPSVCLVELQTTAGNMLVKLYDETPKHRDNFIKLAETGYLNGLLFHRVIKGFMVQAGDPKSKGARRGARLGSGGPGYTIDAEFDTKFIHKKGALSAARQGDGVNPEKKSSGSQFYIVQGKSVAENMLDRISAQRGARYTTEQKEIYKSLGGTPFLDGNYTVFGEVIEGLDIIDRIADQKTDKADRPEVDIKIISLKVIK